MQQDVPITEAQEMPSTPESAPDGAETATLPGAETATPPASVLVEEDLLVEDVSIDGMCGVY